MEPKELTLNEEDGFAFSLLKTLPLYVDGIAYRMHNIYPGAEKDFFIQFSNRFRNYDTSPTGFSFEYLKDKMLISNHPFTGEPTVFIREQDTKSLF